MRYSHIEDAVYCVIFPHDTNEKKTFICSPVSGWKIWGKDAHRHADLKLHKQCMKWGQNYIQVEGYQGNKQRMNVSERHNQQLHYIVLKNRLIRLDEIHTEDAVYCVIFSQSQKKNILGSDAHRHGDLKLHKQCIERGVNYFKETNSEWTFQSDLINNSTIMFWRIISYACVLWRLQVSVVMWAYHLGGICQRTATSLHIHLIIQCLEELSAWYSSRQYS